MGQSYLLSAIKNLEKTLQYVGDVRTDITGPILDAIISKNTTFCKTLKNGMKIEFLYRSKIARDFLLSEVENPDHVWEPQTTKLSLHLAKHSKNAIIGGAYFGDQALLLADALHQHNGHLHTFEPNRDQLSMLQYNCALNNIGNITLNSEGLWCESDKLMRLVGFDSFAYPEVIDDVAPEECFKTITLDDYAQAQNIHDVGLILIDIEGAEHAVLQGATKLIKQSRPSIIFEVHRSYVNWDNGLKNTDIIRFLKAHSYHIFAIRDYNSNVTMENMPVELIPVEKVYLKGPPHGFNMLAVSDLKLITDPLFEFCEDVSPKLLKHKNPSLHQPIYYTKRKAI